MFTWLDQKLGTQHFGGLLSEDVQHEMLELFESLAVNVDEGRRMGIDDNGLAMLAAYCLEGVQHASPLP